MLNQTIAALMLAMLMGCSKPTVVTSPFVHRGTVFHAKSGSDTATSPVEKNYSMDEEGRPNEHRGGMLLQQGETNIRYEFVGTTFCPVSADGKEWNYADVYVLVITKKTGTQTIPIVFRGGKMVVVDEPDLQVVLKQEDREQASFTGPRKLGR